MQIGSRYALESEAELQLMTLLSWGFILGGTKGTCAGRDSLIDKENTTFFCIINELGAERAVMGMLGSTQSMMGVSRPRAGAHRCLPFLHPTQWFITSQQGRTVMESCSSHRVFPWSRVGARSRTSSGAAGWSLPGHPCFPGLRTVPHLHLARAQLKVRNTEVNRTDSLIGLTPTCF